MTDEKTRPTSSNFVMFVWDMSEAAYRLEEFDEDPERVMSEAGLSEEEKEIVRRGDEGEILAAIGEMPECGSPLIIKNPKIVRRRGGPH